MNSPTGPVCMVRSGGSAHGEVRGPGRVNSGLVNTAGVSELLKFSKPWERTAGRTKPQACRAEFAWCLLGLAAVWSEA